MCSVVAPVPTVFHLVVVPSPVRRRGGVGGCGPGWGVGWMFKFNVSGWFAIFMKRLTYIMYWLQVGSYRLAWKRTRQMLRLHR